MIIVTYLDKNIEIGYLKKSFSWVNNQIGIEFAVVRVLYY
jgi:hypothetical protein